MRRNREKNQIKRTKATFRQLSLAAQPEVASHAPHEVGWFTFVLYKEFYQKEYFPARARQNDARTFTTFLGRRVRAQRKGGFYIMADEISFARQVPWFTCYTTIWQRDDLDAESKLIYINLASHAGGNMRAWPSYDTIAQETGLSRRCVINRVKTLESKKLVIKQPRYREDGSQTSNLYLVFPPHEPFNPEREQIDRFGNITTKSSSAQHAPQDVVVHAVHRGGAQHALKYNQLNNTVVVEETTLKQKQQLDKQPEQSEQLKQELAKLIIQKMKTIGVNVRMDDALDIVFENEYTAEFINQQFSYLKEKMPKIKENVVGWFRTNLRRNFKDQLPDQEYVKQSEVKRTTKGKNKNRNRKPEENWPSRENTDKKKTLIQSLYMS